MTETEWLVCANPDTMLDFLWAKASDRKILLLMAAACRRVQHVVKERRYVALLEAGELVADGKLSADAFAQYRTRCSSVELEHLSRAQDRNILNSGDFKGSLMAKRAVSLSGIRDKDRVLECLYFAARGLHARHAIYGEIFNQFDIIQDIFGNPFRPVILTPSWLTSTVLAVAQQMYDSHDFSAVPILADALQEAGCENDEILQHCRGPGPHVKGCFVVDLLLGKS